MKVAFSEPAKCNPNCEIRLGVASWDDGSNSNMSVKYTWFRTDGKAARGGEMPVEALPQAIEFAIRKGFLTLDGVCLAGANLRTNKPRTPAGSGIPW